MCHRTNTHSGNLKARNTGIIHLSSWLTLLIRKSWVFFFQPVLTATLDTFIRIRQHTIMTGLIKLSAGTTGCEWRIRNTNFTEECNLLGYSVSNARERGAGPSGALTEWSPHRDWLSVGTDVLMSLRLERWMSLQAMTDAPKGKNRWKGLRERAAMGS